MNGSSSEYDKWIDIGYILKSSQQNFPRVSHSDSEGFPPGS